MWFEESELLERNAIRSARSEQRPGATEAIGGLRRWLLLPGRRRPLAGFAGRRAIGLG